MNKNEFACSCQGTDNGFTLIEMLMVLLIAAMATGIVGFALSGRETVNGLAEFADHTALLLTEAHQDSIVTGTSRTISFDLQKRTIEYARKGKTHDIPPEFDIRILVGQELIEASGKIPIIFFSEGGSTGIEITVDQNSTEATTIQTSWLTGITRVLDNDEQ